VKQSMIKALGNVAPRHLLDTRLNPPAALRATAGTTVPLKPDTAEPNPGGVRLLDRHSLGDGG
jgi:hypothetical protein